MTVSRFNMTALRLTMTASRFSMTVLRLTITVSRFNMTVSHVNTTVVAFMVILYERIKGRVEPYETPMKMPERVLQLNSTLGEIDGRHISMIGRHSKAYTGVVELYGCTIER